MTHCTPSTNGIHKTDDAPARPDAPAALALIRRFGLNRTDRVAVEPPWDSPACPVDSSENLDELILAHLLGSATEAVGARCVKGGKVFKTIGGWRRIGTYTPDVDGNTRFGVYDCDGGDDHANALAEPLETALVILAELERLGIPAYLESSKSGQGWHVWVFFSEPVDAAKVRRMLLAIIPEGLPLKATSDDGKPLLADPEHGVGVEVFPKGAKVGPEGCGTQVWLPWFHGAKPGGNLFHELCDGEPVPYVPSEFLTTTPEEVDTTLARVAPTRGGGQSRDRFRATRPVDRDNRYPAGKMLDKYLARAAPGTATGRNTCGLDLACQLRDNGYSRDEAAEVMADYQSRVPQSEGHPYTMREAMASLGQAYSHPPREPWGRASERRPASRVEASESPPVPPEGESPARRLWGDREGDEILVTTFEYLTTQRVVTRLATKDPDLYQYAGKLVRVTRPTRAPGLRDRVTASGGVRIEMLPDAACRAKITQYCKLVRENKEGETTPTSPTDWLVKGVMAQAVPWDGIRPLEAVTETPLLRPGGTILQTPGYDEETGILYQPAADFQAVPECVTKDDAIRARDDLLEVIAEFPFADRAHRSAWLASLLTPLARPAFEGPSPVFLTDANIRGCGKGLSSSCVAIIATGRPFAVSSYAHDPIEMNKIITAIALSGEPLVMFDNVAGRFGNSALDAATTATDWVNRILGKSEMTRVPLRCGWYATGNNVTVEGDTARRTCHLRIESPEENPEERSGYTHPDLLAWVTRERLRLLRAALTILAAYCRAGRPQQSLKAWGSFTGWSDLVRQCCVWVGLPDPAETRVAIADADQDSVLLNALLEVWASVYPRGGAATAAEMLKQLDDRKVTLKEEYDTLVTLLPHKGGGLPDPRQLGNTLRRFKGRVCGGRCFAAGKSRTGVANWTVSKPGSAGSAGSAGSNLTQAYGESEISYGAGVETDPADHADPADAGPTVVDALRAALTDADCRIQPGTFVIRHAGYEYQRDEWLAARSQLTPAELDALHEQMRAAEDEWAAMT